MSKPAGPRLQLSPPAEVAEPVETEPSEASELQPPVDPVVEAFDSVCRRLSGFGDSLSTEDMDGYFTAVAASWRAISLDEVLPLLCGDAFERAFGDPADEASARVALQARLHQLRLALDPEALLDDPDHLRLAPLMQVWDDEARQALVQAGICSVEQAAALVTGMSWADGFFRAVEDFSADWPDVDPDDEHAEIYGELLETVAALVMDPASPEFKTFAAKGWKDADPSRDELIDEACFAVQDLRVWWIDHSPKRTPLRTVPTPGRNDPCFCGSGRKYKKCHGA